MSSFMDADSDSGCLLIEESEEDELASSSDLDDSETGLVPGSSAAATYRIVDADAVGALQVRC